MSDYKDMTASEGVAKLKTDLMRLVVLRGELDKGAFYHLYRLITSLNDGMIADSVFEYNALASELICGNYRRVSGDLISDMVMHTLLLHEHPFALMAARCEMEEALYAAMRCELPILQRLSALDDETLLRFIRERAQEIKLKNRPHKDSAAALATAAWGGSTARHSDILEVSPPAACGISLATALPSGEQISLHYGEAALRDDMIADEALSEMYNRFMSNEDWKLLIDDLWNFHASYGSGIFLRSRCLQYEDGQLVPIPEIDGLPAPYAQEGYEFALNNVIAFMRGRAPHHMYIYGDAGTGKTSFALNFVQEFPELRLVMMQGCDRQKLMQVIRKLAAQPLRFMILIDDIEPDALLGVYPRMLPRNILIAATGKTEETSPLFSLRIAIGCIKYEDFLVMVEDQLRDLNSTYDENVLKNICNKIKLETNSKLTPAAINRAVALMLYSNGEVM